MMKFLEWIMEKKTFMPSEIVYLGSGIMVGMTFNYNWYMLPFFLGAMLYGKYIFEEAIIKR